MWKVRSPFYHEPKSLALPPHKIIKNMTIIGQVVQLDNAAYTDCMFCNCVFRWNGGMYALIRCEFQGKVALETQDDNVIAVVDLLKALNMLEPSFAGAWQRLPAEHFQEKGS